MTVTQVEALFGSKSKYRVYLDGQPAFVLYRGELSRYHIREGRELAENRFLSYNNRREQERRRSVMRKGPSGIRKKLSCLEYELSGRHRQIVRIQKSLCELNGLLQKFNKRKK